MIDTWSSVHMWNYAMETLIVCCYGPPITPVRSAIEKHNRGISEEEEEKHNRSTTVAYMIYQRRADIVPWSQHFYRVLHQRRYTIPMWTFNTFTRPRFICDIQLQHWDQGGYSTLYIIQFWYRINHFWSPWRTSFGAIKNIQNSQSAVCQWRTIGLGPTRFHWGSWNWCDAWSNPENKNPTRAETKCLCLLNKRGRLLFWWYNGNMMQYSE